MELQIPLIEASRLVNAKSGKDIALTVINSKTIQVGYDVKVKVPILGEMSKNVVLDVTIDKLVGEKLHLSYSARGMGMDLILKGLLAVLPTSCVVADGHNTLILDLSKIESAHKVLSQIEVEDIMFKDECMIADFTVKA